MARDCNKSVERPYAIESDVKEGRYKLLIDVGSSVFKLCDCPRAMNAYLLCRLSGLSPFCTGNFSL